MTRKSSCRHLPAQARRQNSGVGVRVSLLDHLVGGILKARILVTALVTSTVVPGAFATASMESTCMQHRHEWIEVKHHGLSHAHCLTQIDRKRALRLRATSRPRSKTFAPQRTTTTHSRPGMRRTRAGTIER
jgi:hypothetical protein